MNPLLQPSSLKHSAVPFDKIKAEHFKPAFEAAIEKGRVHLEAARTMPASYKTMLALEAATEESDFIWLTFNNLLVAHSDDDLRALSQVLGPIAAAFGNDILLDEQLFAKVKEVYEQRDKLGLNAEQKYLVEKTYKGFQRNGATLNPEQKQRWRAIDERLSQLFPKFQENVLRATNEFEMWITDEKDLSGLPEGARIAARDAAKAKGRPDQWLFNLQGPSYLAFMRYADSRPLREKLYRAYLSRAVNGSIDNRPVIVEMVRLMTEKSQLIGHRSFADYALELRMAETPTQVSKFLKRIYDVVKPVAEKEVAEVTRFARELGGPERVEAWDFSYYSEKLKEKLYSFDEESLRPYFKLENVLNGVFEHARRLYGLKFQASTEYPVYHKEVQVFEVTRENGGEFVGLFYTDFFPRESKSQGAWMTNYYEQGPLRGKPHRPHVSIVCNFTRPTDDKPSLLTFDEVLTLFHEFGHSLHGLLSKVEHRTLAGTNVYLDFVELPSQIMENWAEEKESLALYAHHYKTGALIPDNLIESLKRSQKFQVGYLALRQLNFAFLDLAWFSEPLPEGVSVEAVEEAAVAACRVLPKVDGTLVSTGFTHIFSGQYASGYYSYKWAEALDADAFELFKEKGLFDRATAQRFEEFILSKGGSDHPMRLYEKFRGRKPDPEALLRRDGLLN